LRPLANKHGLAMQDIDSNGDGAISFSEFFEYFGRPGCGSIPDPASPAAWKKARLNKKDPYDVKQLPMKQHIRIVREDAVESFISAMHASMEISIYTRSYEGSGQHDEGPKESSAEVKGRVIDRILMRMMKHGGAQKSTAKQDVQKEKVNEAVEKGPEDPGSPKRKGKESKDDSFHLSNCELQTSAGLPSGGTTSSSRKGSATSEFSHKASSHGGSPTRGRAGEQSPKSCLAKERTDDQSSSSLRLSLCKDSERSVSREQNASQSHTSSEPCTGCWFADGPLKWLGIVGITMNLGCGRANPSGWESGQMSADMGGSMEARRVTDIMAI